MRFHDNYDQNLRVLRYMKGWFRQAYLIVFSFTTHSINEFICRIIWHGYGYGIEFYIYNGKYCMMETVNGEWEHRLRKGFGISSRKHP